VKHCRRTEVADAEEEEMVAVLAAPPPPLMADGRGGLRRIIIFISLGPGMDVGTVELELLHHLRIRWGGPGS
jgi:hypothetical protein